MADRDTYELEFVSMVQGYHEYRSVWSAVVGEELQCKIGLSNPHDLLAIAVCKSDGVAVDSTFLLATSMEDDGTISERGLGRGSVDRLIGLKYLRSAILQTHVIVQNSVF